MQIFYVNRFFHAITTFNHFFINKKNSQFFLIETLYNKYSKNQFDAYLINILEIVFEYYQCWFQWT